MPYIYIYIHTIQRLEFDSATLFSDWTGSAIASSRLASLASTIAMGGGGPKPEHLLVILPFREPVEELERIKRKHPNIEVTFRSLRFTDTPWKGIEEIPKGKLVPSGEGRNVLTHTLFAF